MGQPGTKMAELCAGLGIAQQEELLGRRALITQVSAEPVQSTSIQGKTAEHH